MKTEYEKMRSEEFYNFTSKECLASYFRAMLSYNHRRRLLAGRRCDGMPQREINMA